MCFKCDTYYYWYMRVTCIVEKSTTYHNALLYKKTLFYRNEYNY